MNQQFINQQLNQKNKFLLGFVSGKLPKNTQNWIIFGQIVIKPLNRLCIRFDNFAGGL